MKIWKLEIRKFENSKIQKFKNSKIQKFKNSKIQKFKNSDENIFKRESGLVVDYTNEEVVLLTLVENGKANKDLETWFIHDDEREEYTLPKTMYLFLFFMFLCSYSYF